MLHVFGFNRVGVAVGELYFLDPQPDPGQTGRSGASASRSGSSRARRQTARSMRLAR
jgi:hypothetical protein